MNRHEIPAWRKRHGDMSQETFAKLIGRSRRTIVNWESGTVQVPHWLEAVLATFQEESK